MNYLKYDDCNEKNDLIIDEFLTSEGLDAEEINQILNNLHYKKQDMPSKLLKYILAVSRMKPITKEKVIKLSEKEYNVVVSNKSTAPSIFTNVVVDNILKLNKTETEVTLSLLSRLGTVFYDIPKSRDVFYTKIRKPILQKYGNNSKEYIETLELMKITKEERTKLNKDYKAKIKSANKDRKTYYSEDLICIIEETKDNEDWATEAIGLMLASGTRPVELLDRNKFKIDPKRKEWIIVSDIAKKRENKKDAVTSRPIIGYTGKQFINAVSDFRESISDRELYIQEGSDKGQLKKSNVALISSRLKKYFPNDPEITPKTLRKLYGNLAHALYGENSNLNVFLGEVLGHDENDQQTSFSYSTVRVIIGNNTSNSDNSNFKLCSPELEVKQESLDKKNEMLENKLQKMGSRIDEFGLTIGKSIPCKPNPKNLSIEKKEQIVRDTIKKMVENGEKISQDRVICNSGINWRVTRKLVTEYKKGIKEIQ